jgi:acyl-CoA thioesterase
MTVREGDPEAADALQKRAEQLVSRMLANDRFSAWLGVRVVELAPGRCTVRATIEPEMLNGFGVCHGGVTFGIADSALAFASNTHGKISMSVENGISYVAPVMSGDVLTATAQEEGVGGRLAFYRVTVTNQNKAVVALFRGTVYRTRRPLVPEEIDQQ